MLTLIAVLLLQRSKCYGLSLPRLPLIASSASHFLVLGCSLRVSIPLTFIASVSFSQFPFAWGPSASWWLRKLLNWSLYSSACSHCYSFSRILCDFLEKEVNLKGCEEEWILDLKKNSRVVGRGAWAELAELLASKVSFLVGKWSPDITYQM